MKKDIKMKERNSEPRGIGGWLLIPTVGFFTGIVLVSLALISLFLSDNPDWFLIVLYAVLLILDIIALVLEFKKKKVFILFVIGFIIYGVIFDITTSIYNSDYSLLPLRTIFNVVWILYFITSRRVRNTFTK